MSDFLYLRTMDNENKNQLSIELRPEVASGHYSNLAIISHSHSEIILDFAQMFPGGKATVASRIIMAPEHAKRLLNALAENVTKYEHQFGKIDLGRQQPVATFNVEDLLNGSKS